MFQILFEKEEQEKRHPKRSRCNTRGGGDDTRTCARGTASGPYTFLRYAAKCGTHKHGGT